MVQVNQWLTWLETAEEEESEGEDFWGTRSKPCDIRMQWKNFFCFVFFPNFVISLFLGRRGLLLSFPLSNQLILSPLYEYFQPLLQFIPLWNILSDQASIATILLYLCFSFWFCFILIWCPTADVLYISIILGYVFFTVGSIVQGNCTSTKIWPILSPFTSGVTKCCHNY